MNKRYKILATVLSILLVFGLAACQGTPTTTPTTPNGTTAATTAAPTTHPTTVAPQAVTISMLLAGDNTPQADNLVLQEIKKKTGYTINMTYVPGADKATKLSAMIAAKTLPDLFTVGTVDAVQLRDAGMITDLSSILQTYAPLVWKEVGSEIYKAPVNANKKIYMVFRGALGYPMNLSIRTDWLANVGLKMPTDLDSLYNVFKAFTENDPNKNGKKDTYGLAFGLTTGLTGLASIFGAYGIPITRNIPLADGTVTTWFKHPDTLTAIKYVRKLYAEGLIEPNFATIPTMDMFGKLWTGVAGAMDFQCVGTTNNWMPGRYTETPVPTFDFATITGPTGKKGVPAMYKEYNSGWVVASSCKYPTEVCRLVNFFTSEEGDTLLYLGVENVMFKWTDKATYKYEKIKPYDDVATQRAAGAFVYHGAWSAEVNMETRLFNAQTVKGVALARSLGLVKEEANIIGAFKENTELATPLGNIIKEAMAQLIVTKGDVDAEYKAFVKRWEDEGGKKWEAAATTQYKAEQAAAK